MKKSFRGFHRSGSAKLAAVAAVLLVAGCSAVQQESRPVCPGISLLPDAGVVTLFKSGPGRDLIDVENVGQVVGLRLKCGDLEPDGMAAVAVVDLMLRRGPSSNPDKAAQVDVPYFVAVVDRTGAIRDKAVFRTTVAFQPGVQVAGVREEIDVKILITEERPLADSGVMVGFQLTPEQYDYNRRQTE